MADLHAVAQRHMEARGMSLRALAKALHHDPSYLSKALRGLKPCGPRLARDMDDVLAAGGEIIAAASRSRPVPDPDRAVAAAAEAASAVRATGSARLRREIRAIPKHAASWSGTSAGHELREIVATVS
jgi:hypothetical protein